MWGRLFEKSLPHAPSKNFGGVWQVPPSEEITKRRAVSLEMPRSSPVPTFQDGDAFFSVFFSVFFSGRPFLKKSPPHAPSKKLLTSFFLNPSPVRVFPNGGVFLPRYVSSVLRPSSLQKILTRHQAKHCYLRRSRFHVPVILSRATLMRCGVELLRPAQKRLRDLRRLCSLSETKRIPVPKSPNGGNTH